MHATSCHMPRIVGEVWAVYWFSAPLVCLSTRPWTTFLPLVIVLGVSMIKEGVEDYKRYKADKEVNNRPVERLNPSTGALETVCWRDLKVGNIVLVPKDTFFPADLLFLTAENEEGTCYIETMNLDGETNLKIKKAMDETKDYKADNLPSFKARVECEPPNSRLYQFTGNMLLEPPLAPEGTTLSLGPAAILLRGCSLRNIDRVFGAVIYAGTGCPLAGWGLLLSDAWASTPRSVRLWPCWLPSQGMRPRCSRTPQIPPASAAGLSGRWTISSSSCSPSSRPSASPPLSTSQSGPGCT